MFDRHLVAEDDDDQSGSHIGVGPLRRHDLEVPRDPDEPAVQVQDGGGQEHQRNPYEDLGLHDVENEALMDVDADELDHRQGNDNTG